MQAKQNKNIEFLIYEPIKEHHCSRGHEINLSHCLILAKQGQDHLAPEMATFTALRFLDRALSKFPMDRRNALGCLI